MKRHVWICLLVGLCGPSLGLAQSQPVHPAEQANWTDWVIPLPQEIRIDQKIVLLPHQVQVRLRAGAGEVEKNAASQLQSWLDEKSQAKGQPSVFAFFLGVIDKNGKLEDLDLSKEASRLRSLPNSDQAYVIRPLGQDQLVLAAVDEKGVFYAVQTLRQLLEGKFSEGKVQIPLAVITDWPDLPMRGIWEDPFTANELKWLSHYKYNFFDAHVNIGMTPDGRGQAKAQPRGHETLDGLTYNEFCRRHGIRFVPVITHIGHLKRTGIYDKHPDLVGQGEHIYSPRFSKLVAPCVSKPKFKQILVDWMMDLASQENVEELYAWLTEEEVYCSCKDCLSLGQQVAETRVLVAAYREVQKQYPNLKFRICLTQGSYPMNDKVLREIPHDIGAIYYDGGRSYLSDQEPMIYPVLMDYLRQGGKMGVVPQYTVSWALVIPWSCPQFIKFRVDEFIDKGLYLVCSYICPRFPLYPFNTMAAAEWQWNAKGRSEREFAKAWATRNGFADPVYVADWAVTLGKASWDLYGSSFPYKLIWNDIGDAIKGRVRPMLGTDFFKYYASEDRFGENIAICEKALAMAEAINDPMLINESRVTLGYHHMLKELYSIMLLSSEYKSPDAAAKERLQQHLAALIDAALQTNESLEQWAQRVGASGQGRFKGTVNLNAKILKSASEALESMGIENPAKDKLPPVFEKKD